MRRGARHFESGSPRRLPFLVTANALPAEPIVVGSKKFTESYVLGDIAKTVLERARTSTCSSDAGMGGTIILWQALQGGQIDVYPEYTGTIGEEILKTKRPLSEDEMREGARKIRRWDVRGSWLQQYLRARHASGRKQRNLASKRSAICAGTRT